MRNCGELLTLFEQYETFALSTHIRPDGDAIGAVLGLYFFLKKLGKSVRIFNTDEVPETYRFLPSWDAIEGLDAVGRYRPEVLVVLDASTHERIGMKLAKKLLPLEVLVNIDHHATAEAFGDVNVIDADASSTSEIVYRLIKAYAQREGTALEVWLCEASALCLYTGIMFDTGCFRHSNATADTHRVAAALIEIGEFPPDEVYRNVYEQVPVSKIRLLREILGTLNLAAHGKIASVYVTQEMFDKTGTGPESVEGVANQLQAIAGVEVAICVTELADGNARVSLRSKGNVDVGALAAEFKGGGHKRAAGCRVEMSYLVTVEKLVARAHRYIPLDQESSQHPGNLENPARY